MADEYGWDKNNPKHQESYWEGRSDPRDKDDSYMKFNSHYYNMIDRQIAADHHERMQAQAALGQGGSGSGKGQNSGSAGGSSWGQGQAKK